MIMDIEGGSVCDKDVEGDSRGRNSPTESLFDDIESEFITAEHGRPQDLSRVEYLLISFGWYDTVCLYVD